ncbi:MAG: VWA domain-containing protein [Planctomycetota bacterium]
MTLPGGWVLRDPLFLLAALVVAAAWLWRRRAGEPALRFAPGALLRPLAAGARVPAHLRPRLAAAAQVAGLLLLVLAAARPAEIRRLPQRDEGIDVALALDLSSSMATSDLGPDRDRLTVAREAARAFVAERASDRVALLTFARFSDLRCPLTRDHRALDTMLAGLAPVDPEGPEDATAIGAALARGLGALGDGATTTGGKPRSRVMILLTDGEENVATAETPGEIAPLHAGQLARERGVRVYTVALGRGRPGPEGETVEIDTRALERVAEMTGARFFRARDASDLERVYASISTLETTPVEEPRHVYRDLFAPLLALGGALFLVGRLLAAGPGGVLP